MNQEEFRRIVDCYSDMVTRICYMRTGNMEDAKDCYQNVFLKCYSSLSPIGEEQIKAWLIRVAINECTDFLRKEKKIVKVPIEDWKLSKESSPQEGFHNYEKRSLVKDSIRKLKDDYQNVIYLYYYEQYKISEIAGIRQQPENTIKTQLKRAREELAKLLKGELD